MRNMAPEGFPAVFGGISQRFKVFSVDFRGVTGEFLGVSEEVSQALQGALMGLQVGNSILDH